MLLLKIVNDGTGKNGKGNYKYEVLVTDVEDPKKLVKLADGEVKNHHRSMGWEELISKISKEVQKRRHALLMEIIASTQDKNPATELIKYSCRS